LRLQEHDNTLSMNQEEAMRRLGVSCLRGKQQDAITAVNNGADVLYLFPTGTGKTFVYECCALMSSGVTIVVSPLLGLLQEQSSKLAARGVGVLESFDGKVWFKGSGDVKVIYTTPEQLAEHSSLRKHLTSSALCIDRLVIDEAHVLVQWETFRYATQHLQAHNTCQGVILHCPELRRPMYTRVASLRGVLTDQFVACTATADEHTREEIASCLGLNSPTVVCMPLLRHNMSIFVTRKHPAASERDLVLALRRSSACRVLLFCRTCAETERVSKLLRQNDLPAVPYHSRVQNREQALQRFREGVETVNL
jgi:superfamily II DNA helicase RecQ